MLKNYCSSISVLLAIILAGLSPAEAQVPQLLSYQGVIVDTSGNPISDSLTTVIFKIWDDPVSTLPVNLIYDSGPVSVRIRNGLFSVAIGEAPMAPLEPAVIGADSSRWLSLTVGADSELLPRTKLTSNFYAFQSFHSDTSDFAHTAGFLGGIDASGFALSNHAHTPVDINPQGSGSELDADRLDGQDASDFASAVHSHGGLWDSSGGNYHYSGGNVGIGTVGPSQKLEVNGIVYSSSGGFMFPDGTTQSSASQGDITDVIAAAGLSGGGSTGSVMLGIQAEGVNSVHIANNSITNEDIYSAANIAPTKISGTAMNLSSPQTVTGDKTYFGTNLFDGPTLFNSKTMRVDSIGITIGSLSNPTDETVVDLNKTYNDVMLHRGLRSSISNSSTGASYGLEGSAVSSTAGSGGTVYGVYGTSKSDGTPRTGVYGIASGFIGGLSTGSSYGVRGAAHDGQFAYGVYGYAASANVGYGVYGHAAPTNATAYAGFFSGNVVVTGNLSKGSGSFKIDHPLDPENKYLYHSFVESPDMMNVYNGNITTDASGKAVIELPGYFGALNRDFRYQLTVIGQFSQAIVSEEIQNNRFSIRTDKPLVKVSWQVTGIRKDAYAEANRIPVEVDKPASERGLYLHPKAFGKSYEKFIHYRLIRETELKP